MNKKIIGAIAILSAGIISGTAYFLHPGGWQKRKATPHIVEVEESIKNLTQDFTTAKSLYKKNKKLIVDQEIDTSEVSMLEGQLADTKKDLIIYEKELAQIKEDVDNNDYQKIRRALDPGYDVEEGETKATLGQKLATERDELATLITFLVKKRTQSLQLTDQEMDLKSSLKKPIQKGATSQPELEDLDLTELDDKYLMRVAVYNPETHKRILNKFPDLNNRLGYNLVKHLSEVEHVLAHGTTDREKDKARDLFEGALHRYIKVEPLNDTLPAWYRVREHGTKMSTADNEALLATQEKPIVLMHVGDNMLEQLTSYLAELHHQEIVYVSEHRKTKTMFPHSETTCLPTVEFDAEGNLEIGIECDTEEWETYGYTFYFGVTIINPQGKSAPVWTQVGTLDSKSKSERDLSGLAWNYTTHQQVGWVSKWKQLHTDNRGNQHGTWDELQPKIDQYTLDCVGGVVEVETKR